MTKEQGKEIRDRVLTWPRVVELMEQQDPISLMDIDAEIQEGLARDQIDWHEAMCVCIASLLRRGRRPMLYDERSGTWQWTDQFTVPEMFGDGPEGIADAAVTSWVAFGDSGGAEDLRFATELPAAGSSVTTQYRKIRGLE